MSILNEREMFEESFKRPSYFFSLTPEHQWSIDSRLGILDWKGEDLTDEDRLRYKKHYSK